MEDDFKIALILEDHKLFADTMAKILVDYGFFKNVLVFTNEQDLIKYVLNSHRKVSEQYFFLDYYVGQSTLPPLLAELRRLLRNPKVIVISGITNPALLHGLLPFKPRGIIHKIDDMTELITCLREIENGNSYYSETVTQLLQNKKETNKENPFSPREIELLGYFARGSSIETTAEALSVSPYTIAAHRRKMFTKAKCNNITELLMIARELEII